MKFKIAIALLISFYKVSFSQNIEWNYYDFDSVVSVEMPFEVYEIDTIQDNKKMYQIYSNSNSIEFRVQKLYLGKLYSNVEAIKLPHDEDSLEKYYAEMIWVITEMIQSELGLSKRIEKFNLKGHKLVFNNDKGLPVHEIDLFNVNKNIYSFYYSDTNGLKESERKRFFDSVTFNNKISLKQYNEKPSLFNKKIIAILLSLLLVSFILRVRSKRKRN